MDSERRKQALFSIDEFIILIAWLGTLLTILYFKTYEFIVPAIVAFVILNLALGVWVNRFVHPIQKRSYRQYLTIQTLFLLVWCPLLMLILIAKRNDLIMVWIAVLVVFYLGIGVISGRQWIRKHQEVEEEGQKSTK